MTSLPVIETVLKESAYVPITFDMGHSLENDHDIDHGSFEVVGTVHHLIN